MFAITNFDVSYDSGFITCEFKRPSEFTLNDDNVPANINTFRLLQDKYVIFLAEGTFKYRVSQAR